MLANVWCRDYVVAINLGTEMVLTRYDFSTLYTTKDKRGEHQVLNGITVMNAKQNDNDVGLVLTGKNCPKMYRIQLHQ